jgi:hypothetical protein
MNGGPAKLCVVLKEEGGDVYTLACEKDGSGAIKVLAPTKLSLGTPAKKKNTYQKAEDDEESRSLIRRVCETFIELNSDYNSRALTPEVSDFVRLLVQRTIMDMVERGVLSKTLRYMLDANATSFVLGLKVVLKPHGDREKGKCLVQTDEVYVLEDGAMKLLECKGSSPATKTTLPCIAYATGAFNSRFVFYKIYRRTAIVYSEEARRLALCQTCLATLFERFHGADPMDNRIIVCNGNRCDSNNCPCCGTKTSKTTQAKFGNTDSRWWLCETCSRCVENLRSHGKSFWQTFLIDYAEKAGGIKIRTAADEKIRTAADEKIRTAADEKIRTAADEKIRTAADEGEEPLVFDVMKGVDVACKIAISVDQTPEEIGRLNKLLVEHKTRTPWNPRIYVHAVIQTDNEATTDFLEGLKRFVQVREALLEMILHQASVPIERVLVVMFGKPNVVRAGEVFENHLQFASAPDANVLVVAVKSKEKSPWTALYPSHRCFAFGMNFGKKATALTDLFVAPP